MGKGKLGWPRGGGTIPMALVKSPCCQVRWKKAGCQIGFSKNLVGDRYLSLVVALAVIIQQSHSGCGSSGPWTAARPWTMSLW